MSESSDKESIQEEQSVNGDEDLCAERELPPHSRTDDVSTGWSGTRTPQDRNDAAANIGTGGSGTPRQ
jgi:hypothetical protein